MLHDDLPRYSRQMLLPGFGEAGQSKLASAHAAIVGVGALGCALADSLVRAGVGRLTIIDRDIVEWSNLQRQVLFDERDARAGLAKVEAAAARLGQVNTQVRVRAIAADLVGANARDLLMLDGSPPDILLDGTDNFETRYLLNDLSVLWSVPFAYAGVVGTRGTQATFVPSVDRATGPCLRCVFPQPPLPGSVPTCETAGVLGPCVAIAAGAQAADALKVLTGNAHLLTGTLLEFDVWNNVRRRIDLRAAGALPDCACCGRREFAFLNQSEGDQGATLCGRQAVQLAGRGMMDFETLSQRLAALGRVERSRLMLRFFPSEKPGVWMSVFGDGRTIVQGVSRVEEARTLHARFIGA